MVSVADAELLEVAARPGGLHVYAGSDYRTNVDRLERQGFLRRVQHENGYCRWHITLGGGTQLHIAQATNA